jgi:hypothetical protein
MKYPLAYILAIILLAASCRKPETYSVVPEITFKELVKNFDAKGVVTSIDIKFDFTDGDGDIGLTQNDVSGSYAVNSPYYYNLIVDYLEFDKSSGKYIHIYPASPIEGDTSHVQYNARLPYIVPSGKNKALKGEITQNINTFGFGAKVKLEFFIYDRALHKSNQLTTPVIEI